MGFRGCIMAQSFFEKEYAMKKSNVFLSFLLVSLLTAGSIFFIHCGGSSQPEPAPNPESATKLNRHHAGNIKAYHKLMFGDHFNGTFESKSFLIGDDSNGTFEKKPLRAEMGLQGLGEAFDVGTEIFGNVSGVMGVVSSIMGWAGPNYAAEDTALLTQMNTQLSQLQTSINNLSTQITNMQTDLTGQNKQISAQINKIVTENLTSTLQTYFTNIDEIYDSLGNCGLYNPNSPDVYLNCVNGVATDSNMTNLTNAFWFISALPSSTTLSTAQTSSDITNSYYTEFKSILANANTSSLHTSVNGLYTNTQDQVGLSPGELEDYNRIIAEVQTYCSDYLVKWYWATSAILGAQYLMANNNIAPNSTNYGIPDIGGTKTYSTSITNALTFFKAAANSLAALSMNNIISDMDLSLLNCAILNEAIGGNAANVQNLCYPFQSPKYWTGLPKENLPDGNWKNNCILYRWSQLGGGYTGGSWDGSNLTVQCAPITMLGNDNCNEFDAEPVEMSIAYSTICNSGSEVSAQYTPTLNGQTEAPMAYGYCSSVNMDHYNDSANYTNTISQTTGYAPSTSCSGDGTHVSGCDSCQWGIYFNPNGYFLVEGTADTFPATCSWTSNSFGLWASYEMFDDGGWGSHCAENGCSGGPYQYVIGVNTGGSSAYTSSGAFVMEGVISTSHGAGHPDSSSVSIAYACYKGDELCTINHDTISLCYGLDQISLGQPSGGWTATFSVTPNGCYDSYADKTNLISNTAPAPSIAAVSNFPAQQNIYPCSTTECTGSDCSACSCGEYSIPIEFLTFIDPTNLTNKTIPTAIFNPTYNNLGASVDEPICQFGSGFGIAAYNPGITADQSQNFINIDFVYNDGTTSGSGNFSGEFPLMISFNDQTVSLSATCYWNDSTCSVIANSDSERSYSQICLNGQTILVQPDGHQNSSGDGFAIVWINTDSPCTAGSQPYCNDSTNTYYNQICNLPAISGTVTTGSGDTATGEANVTITLTSSSGNTQTTTTDSSGNYSIQVINGTYTVTPSSSGGGTFSPANTQVTVSNANVPNVDFTYTPSS